nr:MAG TPA: hypothetical protein [Caudoviricetes sp.]
MAIAISETKTKAAASMETANNLMLIWLSPSGR